jgi:galactose mutarotase-like enzyme
VNNEDGKGLEVRTITAPDKSVSATIAPEIGASVSSLVFNGREILFTHPFFWDRQTDKTRGGFPFLFPVCGRLERGGQMETYLYNHRPYRMKIHGFAIRMPWIIAGGAGDSELVLRLRDTDETRAQYPFSFQVLLRFKALPSVFVIEQEYSNMGAEAMPYYAGFHPYFLTPPPAAGKEQTMVDFKPVRRLVYNERLTDAAGEREPPNLPASVADPSINEMSTRVGADKETRLMLPDGLTIHMAATGSPDKDLFPYVHLYTAPDKPFICIEPWMAIPNSFNAVQGSRWLAPGQTERGTVKVWTSRRQSV